MSLDKSERGKSAHDRLPSNQCRQVMLFLFFFFTLNAVVVVVGSGFCPSVGTCCCCSLGPIMLDEDMAGWIDDEAVVGRNE